MIIDNYLESLIFKFSKNNNLPQEIFEQITHIGVSRIDEKPIYRLKKTEYNYNFFIYFSNIDDKKYLRMLKLNKLLGIKDIYEFNSTEKYLIDFFENYKKDIEIIQHY